MTFFYEPELILTRLELRVSGFKSQTDSEMLLHI